MSFSLPGPLMGYVRTTQRQKFADPRYAKYRVWKRTVRLLADKAGVPRELNARSSYALTVTGRFRRRARIDADNLYKGISDALFPNDRRVTIAHCELRENAGDECAMVQFNELTVSPIDNRHRVR